MNLGPAQTQQKIMLITGVVVVMIIAFGSWYVSQLMKKNSMGLSGTTTVQSSPLASPASDFTQGGELVIRMRESQGTNTNGTSTYLLTLAPTQAALTGVSLKLNITNSSKLTTQISSFSTSSSLSGTGWQSMANATEVTDTGMSVEFSLLNLSPEGWMSTQPLEIGLVSFKTTGSNRPEFVLDQESSSAFTKDGRELKVTLVMEPKVSE